jgi:uncharacterized protein YrrD
MQFKHGTHVYTSDNQDIGSVDRVVLDPSTNQVSGLVVRQGWLFTEDKVLPISLVDSADEDRVTLTRTEHNLQELPEFEERYYVPVGNEDEVPSGTMVAEDTHVDPYYAYPPIGTAWWGYGTYGAFTPLDVPNEHVHVKQNIPEGTIAIREGARVYSSEDEHVGDIEEVFTDPATNRATHLVISQGIFFKERKLIPANWLKLPGEDEVVLTVPTRVVEALPEYQPA